MVTGKDGAGALINSGEQVTREQALRMLHSGQRLAPPRGERARVDGSGQTRRCGGLER